MSNASQRRLISLLILWALVFSGFLVSASAARADNQALPDLGSQISNPVTHSRDSPTTTPGLSDAQRLQIALDRLDPSLQQVAENREKGYADVLIYTTDVPRLGAALEAAGARRAYVVDDVPRSEPFVARPWGAVGQLTSLNVQVPYRALVDIASLDGVEYIEGRVTYAPAIIRDAVAAEDRRGFLAAREQIRDGTFTYPPGVTSSGGGSASPTSWAIAREHHAYDVWRSLGYEGNGVNVAVVDTGEDFGNPSLANSWAVETNPASPYFGWPIMFHPASMEGLMGAGWWTATSDLDRLPLPFWLSANDGDSWYSNMDYTVNDSNLDGLLPYRHNTVNPQSGLRQYTPRANPQQYGNWRANWNSRISRDYWIGRPGDAGHIISQSGFYRLGVSRDDTLTGLWGEKVGMLLVDSTTAGIYNTVYVDLNFNFNFTDDKPVNRASPIATADLNGDGIADVSGGLLYFIATTTTATGETVIANIAGTETGADLANTGVAVDIIGQIPNFVPPTRLWLQQGLTTHYLPGSTEDLYEEYTATGAENQTQWALGGPLTTFGPVNYITGQTVNSATLIRTFGIPVGLIYDIEDSNGPLAPGTDFSINMATGTITFLRNFTAGDTIYIVYQLDSYTLEPVSGHLTFAHPLPATWTLLADYDHGLPIPYSDIYGPAHGYDTFIPANGDLVAFHGDFDWSQSHGSFVSSTIAAHPFGNLASPFFEVFGTAPAAKIIGIAACCNVPGPVGLFGSIEDQRTFAAVGYDGLPNTGDEATVMSNSFGDISSLNTGFSFEDRWLYDFTATYPTVTALIAFANNGPGYATGTPGGTSPGVVTVGAGTSGDYRVLFGFDGGEGNYEFPGCPGPPPIDPRDCVGLGSMSGDGPGPYGDIAYFSSRGPSLLGQPKPDVVSIGSYGVEAGPLNVLAVNPVTGRLDPNWADGNYAFDIFSGTSQATPVTAGVAALGVQAYRSTHGGANPTNAMVKNALKMGADDIHRDIFQQGAGWTNALRTVQILADLDGVTASRDFWVPGSYQGVARPAFVNFLGATASDATTITLTNHNPVQAKNIRITDGVYQRMAPPTAWSVSLLGGTGQFYILKPTGIYAVDGLTLLQAEPWAAEWNNADFTKVTWTYDNVAFPGSTSLRLDVFDWYDYQHPVGAPLGVYIPGLEDPVADATITYYANQLVATGVNGESKAVLYDPATQALTGLPYNFSRDSYGLMNDTTPGPCSPTTLNYSSYWIDAAAGKIVLCAPLLDGEGITGNYSIFQTVPRGTSVFLSSDAIVPGSETVYLNGVRWPGLNNWTINYPTGEFVFNVSLAPGDVVDADYRWDHPGFYDGFSERNRMTVSAPGPDSESVWDTFGRLPTKIHDGLVLNPRSGLSVGAIPATLIVEFYQRVDWTWLSENPGSVNIPAAGGTAQTLVTATVPAGTAPGMYQGAIYLTDTVLGTVSTIPVAINVPVTGFPVNLGGTAPATSLYDNNGVVQGARSGWRQIADSRYVFADLNIVDAPGRRMIYNAILQGRNSDPEMFVFNCVPDPDGYTLDATYGPCRMNVLANTKEQLGATNTLFPNKEFMHSAVVNGLIAFQVKSYGATGSAALGGIEPLEANIGIMQATLDSPGNPLGATEVSTATNRLLGSVPLTVWANVPMYGGLDAAVTEAVSTSWDLAVPPYGYPGGDFLTYLFNAPSKQRTDVAPNTISATWSGAFPAGLDTDYGIFYDANCDGVYAIGDSVAGTRMATSANPETFSMGFPPAGCYWVHAAGYDVGGGEISTITLSVSRIGVSAFSLVNPPTTDVAPLSPVSTAVGWSFPRNQTEGVVPGLMFLSPRFAPFALTIGLTLSVQYDTSPVTIQDFAPAPGTTVPDVAGGRVAVVANVYDTAVKMIDITSARLWIDGVDVTQLAKKIPTFTSATECCYNQLTVAYTPVMPFSDGPHSAALEVADIAGNVKRATWSWTVDNTPPTITMTNPAGDGVVRTPTLAVTGTAPGATNVTVNGIGVAVDPLTGAFSMNVGLIEGPNEITVVATDAAGNSASVTRMVRLDTTAPTLINVRSSEPERTRADSTLISGSVGEEVSSLTVNGQAVVVQADGSFATRVSLTEGVNAFTVVATDLGGLTSTVSLAVTRDTVPPVITISRVTPGLYVTDLNPSVTINGTVQGQGVTLVTINGVAVTLGTGGSFTRTFTSLSIGSNVFVVEAQDEIAPVPNRASATVTVTYAPVVQNIQRSYTSVILIAVAVVLLIVGFVVGWMIAGRRGPPAEPAAAPPAEAPPAEEQRAPEPEEIPAEEEMTTEEEEL